MIQKKVDMSINRKDLRKLVKKHKQEADVLRKLYLIQLLYDGKTVEKASELMDVSLSTGHRWL
ncbi:MAG: helix-turn-helix domain-containing protein, partial [Methanobrevibacter sp.]|nr:helix-turn-helix domain-containing protein [Methanobrevibacter sp.]